MTFRASVKQFLRNIFGSADYQRLAGTITEAWIDLDRHVHQIGPDALTEPWARSARRFLLEAESYLADADIQQGWVAVAAARRAMLLDSRDADLLLRTAVALQREVEKKVKDWRGKAISDLICDRNGNLLPELVSDKGQVASEAIRMRVFDAVALRDDKFNTTYFKIVLRRRHLLQLFIILWLGVALCLALSYFKVLPTPLDQFHLVVGVILFGTLGASFSVAQKMMSIDISAKIPDQQIGAFIVWMRPAVGAVAALVALMLFHAASAHKVMALDMSDPRVALAIAFVAGFSERFILRPIGNMEELGMQTTDGPSGSRHDGQKNRS